MPRICFVIMPFSGTKSCTEEEWAGIFENVFKPAIEGAGLDYVCRRSEADRGNVVGKIIRDLHDSYVVVADLTDRNANVFYELGVRHALRNRSIILAQRREDIPFDLHAYASHVYDWKSDEGKRKLAEKIRELLQEIDTNPNRPDNPVSDFLGGTEETPQTSPPVVPPAETKKLDVLSLVGPEAAELDVSTLTRQLSRDEGSKAAKRTYRLTRPELLRQLSSVIDSLNKREVPSSIKTNEIQSIARDFISAGENIVIHVEEFALTSIEEEWEEGVATCLRFAGDLITLTEKPRQGRSLRFATGMPALLAWRMIILMGGKALAEEALDLMAMILNQPLEVEEPGGRFSHRPVHDRRDLFYSEALLGYADHSIQYLASLWSSQPHLHAFFESEDSYHFHIGQFLMIIALANAAKPNGDWPLYPGYRLLPQAERAMSAFCSRLATNSSYREAIARAALGEGGAVLEQKWEELASLMNKAKSGRIDYGLTFPLRLKD